MLHSSFTRICWEHALNSTIFQLIIAALDEDSGFSSIFAKSVPNSIVSRIFLMYYYFARISINLAITICMVSSDILLFSYTHNSLPIPFQVIILHF